MHRRGRPGIRSVCRIRSRTALVMVVAVRNSVTTTAHCQVTIHVVLVVVVSLLSVIVVVRRKNLRDLQ